MNTPDKQTYYKVLNLDRSCFWGGSGQWPPVGVWTTPVKGKLKVCANGYHVLSHNQIVEWLGPAIWEVEPDEEIISVDNKFVTRKARLIRQFKNWNDKTARLFAADCAEHVLPIFEKSYPDNKSPRLAIKAARSFALGEISSAKLAAAWGAAWNATGSAAESAAGSAAWSAAGNAAESAARSAAWSAAESAAGNATWSATWSATGNATWSATINWQTKQLFEYLEGRKP